MCSKHLGLKKKKQHTSKLKYKQLICSNKNCRMTTNETSQALQPNMFHKPAGAVNRVLWTMVMALTRQLLLWRGRCCALTIFSAFHAQLAGASQGHVVQKTVWKLRGKRKNSKHDVKTLNGLKYSYPSKFEKAI